MPLIRSSRSRDLRVDFFRGLALWWIYTDHIPGDVLGNVSLHNFALCDAAEIFVLLAGFGAGVAYGSVMERQGYLYAAADAVRRAWILYVAHIFLFVVYAAQVAYTASALDRVFYLEEARLDVLADAPYRALLGALLLRFQPSLLNILPLYVVLLLIFALALPLLRRPALLFAASFAGYVAVRITGINIMSWTGEGWYFNPFAWQFLFMIGAIVAYAPPAMPRLRWPIDVAAALIALGGVAMIWIVDAHPRTLASVPTLVLRLVSSEDKTGLDPSRLLSILSLTWLVARIVPRSAAGLGGRAAAPLVLLGQNSLPVFCSGIFFGFLARLGLETDDGGAMQLAVNAGGALSMLAVAALAAWYRGKGRAPGARAQVALPAVARTDTG